MKNFAAKLEGIENFNDYINYMADAYGDSIALSQLINSEFQTLTFAELKAQAEKIARFLNARGIKAGDNVTLLSESRLEWPVLAFGTLLSGAVLTPLDIKLTSNELSILIEHSQPELVFYSKNMEKTLTETKTLCPFEFSSLLVDLDKIPDYQHRTIAPVDPEKMSILVYTSGTVGAPKGIMTKLSAILYQVKESAVIFYCQDKQVFLSMLPANHLFEFTAGICAALVTGAELCIANSIEKDHLMYCMQQRKVTQIVSVPLFITNLKKGIERNLASAPLLKQLVFKAMMFIASFLTSEKLKRKLFKPIHDKMGGHIHRMVIGSAATPAEVVQFFNNIGIKIFEGYGLSETGPVISTNSPGQYRLKSVGKPLGSIEVKIDNGEILTRGKHLMMGYYKNPELTSESFDEEGWFRTGDIGYVDKKGFVFITGRKKKMILLEGGKKVYPEEVETLLLNDEQIKEVAVVGRKLDKKSVNDAAIVATMVPSDELKKQYADDWEALEKLMVDKAKNITKALAQFKKPTEYIVLKQDLPKTTTQKVKLNEVVKLVHNHYESNNNSYLN
ncbi:MAG: AMP-binding protein [Bacteriovoracaceae bacterium]|nr:AMP-binding protein [Bacteriovoracaceae bacterium]